MAKMDFDMAMKTKLETVFGVEQVYLHLFIPPVVAQAASERDAGRDVTVKRVKELEDVLAKIETCVWHSSVSDMRRLY